MDLRVGLKCTKRLDDGRAGRLRITKIADLRIGDVEVILEVLPNRVRIRNRTAQRLDMQTFVSIDSDDEREEGRRTTEMSDSIRYLKSVHISYLTGATGPVGRLVLMAFWISWSKGDVHWYYLFSNELEISNSLEIKGHRALYLNTAVFLVNAQVSLLIQWNRKHLHGKQSPVVCLVCLGGP